MPFKINLASPEHMQLQLVSDGVQELNKSLVEAGGVPALLVAKTGELCSPSDDGGLVPVTPDSLAGILRPMCIPVRPQRGTDEEDGGPLWVEEACLPRTLMKAYIATHFWLGVPRVRQVARAPIVRPDFTIRWEEGWDESTSCWVIEGLAKDESLVSSGFDVRNVFDQFPLVDRRLVADALAAALTPLISTAVTGPLPGLIVTARKQGSGKTEFAKFCSIMGNGGKNLTSWSGATELSKTISSYVAEDQRVVIFDNIKNDIDSTTLEQVITSRSTSYRMMREHKTINLRSNTTWFMTANGAVASPDMVRRCVVVMLDKDAYPRGWTGDWVPWVEMSEAALVTLMCSMIENWEAARCVPGSVVHEGFEEWSQVVSGILETAGIGGMFEAREDLVSEAIVTEDEDEMPVVEAIAAIMGGDEWAAGELWEAVNDPLSAMTEPKVAYVRQWLQSVGKVSGSGARPGIPVGRALHPLTGKSYAGSDVVLQSRMTSNGRLYKCVSMTGAVLEKVVGMEPEFGF